MTDRRIVRWIEGKFLGLFDELSERSRRRWAAVEAVSLGRGGIAAVSAATGVAPSTIRRGVRELNGGSQVRDGRRSGHPGRVGAVGRTGHPGRSAVAAPLDLQEYPAVGP